MSGKVKTLFADQPIVELPEKSIFLAGPTGRDNVFARSWRKELLEHLEREGFDGTVCIPEFSTPRNWCDADWEPQTRWEWRLLDGASCILFWVDRHMNSMPGLTTNLEFGTYLERSPEKVVLAYPEGSEAMDWMKYRYEMRTGRKPVKTMQEAARAAIAIAEENYASRHLS